MQQMLMCEFVTKQLQDALQEVHALTTNQTEIIYNKAKTAEKICLH